MVEPTFTLKRVKKYKFFLAFFELVLKVARAALGELFKFSVDSSRVSKTGVRLANTVNVVQSIR